MRIQRRGQLLAEGYTDAELRRGVRDGEIVAVRRGSYVAVQEVPERVEDQHAMDVRAALPGLVPVHSAGLDPDELAVVDGVTVTGLARTVTDIARRVPFEVAVPVADAALYTGRVTPEGLRDAVHRAQMRPGVAAARRVVAFADGGSQSVGESRSRVRLSAAGLPRPSLQYAISTRPGCFHSDFAWEGRRVVGEFDGAGQVRRPAEAGAERRGRRDPGEAPRGRDPGGGLDGAPLDLGGAGACGRAGPAPRPMPLLSRRLPGARRARPPPGGR